MPSFFEDFIFKGEEFNRDLTPEEFRSNFQGFPQAKRENIGVFGKAYVEPTPENCSKYYCSPVFSVLLYNSTGYAVGALEVLGDDYELVQTLWNKCDSEKYQCVFRSQFGATYNCIGWAMGVSKWLDPREIDAFTKTGKTKSEAIKLFIEDKKQEYDEDHISNIDNILNQFNSFELANNTSVNNNTVAFYFDDNAECTHGARFIENINGNAINKWTSKLGNNIAVTHELRDLMGEKSIYGNILHYIGITEDKVKTQHHHEDL